MTAAVIFKGAFYSDLSGFLSYIVVWLAPWFSIVVTDWILRRGEYDTGSLASRRGGVYWRAGGVNWRALVALALGMTATTLWINAQYLVPSYMSPISSATGGTDVSWLFGILVGGLSYRGLSAREMGSAHRRALASGPPLDDEGEAGTPRGAPG